jgi:phosphate transport system protein
VRTAFHERLDALIAHLGEMCGLAGVAMEHATQALLQADLVLAEQVISGDRRVTAMSTKAEESAFLLLALQAPVAGDLRAVISSLQNVADVERMSALALHVAKITRRRHPACLTGGSQRGLRRDGATRRAVGKQRPGSGALR